MKIILFLIAVILVSCAIAQEIKFDRFVDLSIVPADHKVKKGEIIPKAMATAWKINGQLYFTSANHVIKQESYIGDD